ncbi:MAG TPA: choice-of-anchor D domain-containing protein [Candidatus Dormibacteraeota bacterium]|nr:choice-of-anchor D domain-containing protein [Candidatus Dormibacteraeota bacterium]
MRRSLSYVLLLLAATLSSFAQTNDINSTPSSLSFANTYVGKASGSKVLTINNLTTSGQIIIQSIGFTCPGYGISSGIAPFTLGQNQKITHYSIFFQPSAAQPYNCNFVISLNDGTSLNVPISGTGLTSTATASVSPSSLNFPNQTAGTSSAPQIVTITNNGTSSLTLNSITVSPPSFTTNAITVPFTIPAGSSLPVSVFYTPGQVTSETGAIDFTYTSIPDNGSSLTGNGIAATALTVSTQPILPQATQSAAYQATLTAGGGTGPYTWALGNGSTLPLGLTLSTNGVISGTLDPSVKAGTYSFTVQVTDSATSATAISTLTLTVLANLGDNCADLSFNVPNSTTPIVALTDLGTGTYQGSAGGLYPNGSNVRPSSHDADGLALALGIQPLDANGNYSPTGKYVLLAVGESTAQNEFNRFLPIANADPAKNPSLVMVNGAQGGATPQNFTSPTSAYWATTLNNYLPQNGVTPNQVVVVWMEDTDGIATGSFPSDITTMQSEYETMMQTMHTLFPNLKLVYFSSRVYGGYSNGVGKPDNPEPYAFEVGYAVKWAIQDQLNGNANLNYNPLLGPVVAPWMSWGPYYWSNGMLGRSDGLEWDCADFSADGTHPSSAYGQLKVSTALLNFLKTDDTTIPWYLAPSLTLTPTGGNNQTGNAGTILPGPLTVVASNQNGGAVQSGVPVTFSDGGAGGTFGAPVATTDSTGTATTSYTLPSTGKTIAISATSTGYKSASFTETANNVQLLAVSAGNNQSGTVGSVLPGALTVLATSNGNPVSGVSVSFSDGGAGGAFGAPVSITDVNGLASTTYTLPSIAQVITISASSSGYNTVSFSETAANVQILSVNAGNNQTGGVGTALPAALGVMATLNGNPAPGVSVTFSDGGAGGSFGTPVATTNSNGVASTTYTLPSIAQVVTISASSSGYNTVSFSETATNVQILSVNAGNNQTSGVGTTLPAALGVMATLNGNPVPGVSVTFSDGGAGGTFSNPNVTTDSNGLASSTYTLPATAQTVNVTVSSSGYTSALFMENAVVQSLTVNAGNNQNGNVSTTLPTALVVLATSNGTPAPGVSVTFSDGGVGGSFGTPTATTDSNGLASSTYTLPSTAQAVTVTASGSGYTSASFTETAAVQLLAPNAGNNQTGNVGTTLPSSLTVLATVNGAPAPGVTVTFNDGGAGGSFGTPVATTDSNGLASSTYTLPTTAKSVNITTGSIGYTPASFTETAAVQSLSANAGNNQSGNPGTTLPASLTVLATSNGNPAAGVSVTFSDGGAGGTFGTPIGTTDSNGLASSTYTLPSGAQAVTISASSSGYTSASFTETAAVQALSATAGNNQSGNVGTTLPTALTVTATSNGIPVAGVNVTFSDGGAGGSFGTQVTTTGSGGTASSTYTLPSTAKTVTITASGSGYTSASFTETATSGVATLTVVSGGKQSGIVGTTLPVAIVIKAKNSSGGLVSGASISFSDGSTGTFSPNPAITGSNGQASTSYTLPKSPKTYTVTASSGSASVRVTETATVGSPTNFTISSGNNQSAHPNTALPKQLVVKLTDQYFNPISGVTVTFNDNGAGGSFSTTTPVTNSFGQASVTYTTGPNTGTVTINATTSTLGPLSFKETVK